MTHDRAIATHAAERYLLDEMPELERFQFEEHYFACAACAEAIRTGGLLREGVAQGLIGEHGARREEHGGGNTEHGGGNTEHGGRSAEAGARSVEHGARSSEGWPRLLPWAVAAMLAVTTGYQALVVVPGLRDRVVGPQALAPLTLRPASRGAMPEVGRPATGVVSFALDVNGIAAGARLTYDLRAADGASVASGTAVAPPPGAPLLLLVPATAFPSSGSYTLTVGPDAGGGSDVAEYRFTLTDR